MGGGQCLSKTLMVAGLLRAAASAASAAAAAAKLTRTIIIITLHSWPMHLSLMLTPAAEALHQQQLVAMYSNERQQPHAAPVATCHIAAAEKLMVLHVTHVTSQKKKKKKDNHPPKVKNHTKSDGKKNHEIQKSIPESGIEILVEGPQGNPF